MVSAEDIRDTVPPKDSTVWSTVPALAFEPIVAYFDAAVPKKSNSSMFPRIPDPFTMLWKFRFSVGESDMNPKV